MKFISIDVEADGPCPGDYSMISFGAAVVEKPKLNRIFYGKLKPISNQYINEALAVSGFTREDVMKFPYPGDTMIRFNHWLLEIKDKEESIIFISDNPAFDWQFINYYLWHYCDNNPFGHSARRIGDIYCGLVKKLNANRNWKKQFRKTKHDHNPLNDATGNAEAIISICDKFGLKLP